MPELTTITASITYPIADIEEFADRLGYQTVIPNPEIEASINRETGEITAPTLPNPETKIDFVKRMFKAHAVTYFTQFAEREVEATARAMKETTLAQVKQRVESAISI